MRRLGTVMPGTLAALMLAVTPAGAKDAPPAGSPAATAPSNPLRIPNPPGEFGGVINLDAQSSTPYWQPRLVPPEGAPNILLVLIDDEGFGAPSTFGGVIPTPELDRIADAGLRYTQFHTRALCSPTRAALITDRAGEVTSSKEPAARRSPTRSHCLPPRHAARGLLPLPHRASVPSAYATPIVAAFWSLERLDAVFL